MTDQRDRLIQLASQRFDSSRVEAVTTFIQAYLPHIPSNLREAMDDGGLLSFLLERFDVLDREPSISPKIRLGPRPSGMPFIRSGFTVLEIRSRDLAFIVKTLRNFLLQRGVEVQLLMHPVVAVSRRQGTGAIDRVQGDPVTDVDGYENISHVYAHLSPISQGEWAALADELATRYRHLELVNADFRAMQAHVDTARAELEEQLAGDASGDQALAQASRFLEWARGDNFIFLGHARYPASGSGAEDTLGLLHPGEHERLAARVAGIARRRFKASPVLSVYRTDLVSPVKSIAQLRYVGVKLPDGGERVFVGLLSARGMSERNSRIPIIAEKIDRVMALLDPRPGSYAFKSYWTTLDALPNEDLFYSDVSEIVEVVRLIHEAGLSSRPRVHIRRSSHGTRISVLAMMPRSAYSAAIRQRVLEYLAAELNVPTLRNYACTSDPDIDLIHLHYYISLYREGVTEADLQRMSERVHELLLTWSDQLRLRLEEQTREGEEPGALGERYRNAFPAHYRDTQAAAVAVHDIRAIEALLAQGKPQVRLLDGEESHEAILRIYTTELLSLSDVVPVLNNLGLRCAGKFATEIDPAGAPTVYLSSFEASLDGDGRLQREDHAQLAEMVASVLAHERENDPLLRLVPRLSFSGRKVDLLILYRNYFMQLYKDRFRKRTIDAALLGNDWAAQLLRDYFMARFDPARSDGPKTRATGPLAELEATFRDQLAHVASLAEGEALERLLDLFKNSLRTNYFKAGPPPTIAVKFDCRNVAKMKTPRPMYEIYLRNKDVAGCHLRGGKVARGGLRWSDRFDDFRDEVLGLMKTQMSKNSVIVPVGSKGGFVVRNLPEGREAADAWVRQQYRAYIGGLLDITDNVVEGTVRHPENVLIYDDEDPYLVVAADKGTARLSDTANGVSREYGFWLDDAFASGGSAGYDHKGMGITARGAWESVKRHFRELDVDIDRQTIRVVGIGDMSGDVFGNGMLLNAKMKLVGAFNHRHIFIDPDPDPDLSFAERKRLFGLPRSNWTDYSPDVLSRGGGVFDREARAVRLSPEMRAALGVSREVLSGPELIRALLMAPVDLLWFGGIGTYVKAGSESNVDVADQANDAVRIDATELRCRVVGEGANLGLTARARDEFSLAGGLLNTDALDNSAGVNCSDHEVNLKILLRQLIADGELSGMEERNALLAEMTDEVAELVLRYNYRGSASVSLEQRRAAEDVERLVTLIGALVDNGVLDREGEQIASDDQLRDWVRTGVPTPRNQLAVILAHAKMVLYERLLASELPEQPMCEVILVEYFPRTMRVRFNKSLRNHPLRREIISTRITNALIDQAGSLLITALEGEEMPLEIMAERYMICEMLMDAPSLRLRIEGLDGRVATEVQYAALEEIERTLLAMLRWWTWNADRWAVDSHQLAAVRGEFAALMPVLAARIDHVDGDGVMPEEVSRRLAQLPMLRHGLTLLDLRRRSGCTIEEVIQTFLTVHEQLGLDALERALDASARNPWERRFKRSTEKMLSRVGDELVHHVLVNEAGSLDAFIAHHEIVRRLAIDAHHIAEKMTTNRLVPVNMTLADFRTLLESGQLVRKATTRRRRLTIALGKPEAADSTES